MDRSRTTSSPPRWHILGTGAMACLWGSCLSRGGSAVTLMGREPFATGPMQLQLVDDGLESAFPCEIVCASRYSHPVQRLLVATKAYAVEDALDSIAASLSTDSRVVLLQNGMGFQRRVAERWPQVALFCALSTEGAWRRAPLQVVHAGRGQTALGAWNPRDQQLAKALRDELARSDLDVRCTGNVQDALWRKLAINCVINPLTALYRCHNGDLLKRTDLRDEFKALLEETGAILIALGHTEIADSLCAEVERVARATGSNRSSMLQDLLAGQRTEIDSLNGYLCQQAEAAGLDCPCNHKVWQRILEATQRCQG